MFLFNKRNFFFIASFFFFFSLSHIFAENTVNLVGTWEGTNKSYSLEKGHRNWSKKITIYEQKEKIFKGTFKYSGGKRNFLGVIRFDNKTFYWVSSGGKGYIHGEILDIDTIEACYIEAGKNAAVGCTILKRKKNNE